MAARLDGRNPRAEAFLKEQSSTLITAITEDIRDAARQILYEAVAQGTSTRQIALDLVGRVNRRTGQREGGIIGLDDQQIEWVYGRVNPQTGEREGGAWNELRSGDPAQLRNYLKRKQRDRRFDGNVTRAIQNNGRIAAADAQLMVDRYKAKLLRLRGERIARTETHRALHEAQDEALRQMVDRGVLATTQIKRRWDAAEDMATRPTHAALDDTVQNINGVFRTTAGHLLKYPGDTSLGAPAEEVINCRCVLRIDIDVLEGLT